MEVLVLASRSSQFEILSFLGFGLALVILLSTGDDHADSAVGQDFYNFGALCFGRAYRAVDVGERKSGCRLAHIRSPPERSSSLCGPIGICDAFLASLLTRFGANNAQPRKQATGHCSSPSFVSRGPTLPVLICVRTLYGRLGRLK